jgi:twitching motility protein PilT
MIDLSQLLRVLATQNASDLHLTPGAPPMIRIDGALKRLGAKAVSARDTEEIAKAIVPRDRLEDLRTKQQADFAHALENVGRFRVNVFRQRGSISFVLRRVRLGSGSFDELALPESVMTLADMARGLVLVTGPTGSGKTTTLACMVDHINSTKPVHILTVEDPIEVLHPHKKAAVNQREIGVDALSYVEAMRAAMRQDPDVILIGEMRDPETVAAALSAGETGHFVLSTLHTTNAVETVNRIVDFFPPFQQHQARVSLASVLRGVICQRLVPRKGGGRVPALEVLVNNGRVADRIVNPETTPEINGIIAEGNFYGMQSFDQSLLSLLLRGLVTEEDAFEAATSPHDLRLMLEQAAPAPAWPVDDSVEVSA